MSNKEGETSLGRRWPWEDIELPDEVQDAVDLLISPANREDIKKNNAERFEAYRVIDEWQSEGSGIGRWLKINDLLDPPDGVYSGIPPAREHTNPITPSTLGTGISRQEKRPRDLRDHE
jgi:hypothetical protein